MKSSARHTLSNQQAQLKEAETVDPIEMMQSHFQGPLLGCFEYVHYTALTIVLLVFGACDCCCECVSISHSFSPNNWFIQLQIG